MLDMFHSARWDQASDFLSSGDPPVIFRLLAINTLFLIFFVIRKARSKHGLKESAVMQMQAVLLAANCLILFQNDVQHNAVWAMNRIMAQF